MNEEEKTIVLCPSCLARYRVSERLLNSRVVCKKCGNPFTATREDARDLQKSAPPAENDRPLHELPFDISVSADRLTAYLVPKGGPGAVSSASPARIRAWIVTRGIRHGIAEDEAIAAYLATPGKEPMKVAVGEAPRPGRDAAVRYFFETDPLRIGRLKADGSVDFRDRGDIPQVKAGDLLAQKSPAEVGRAGKDVYGELVPAPKPKDVRLRCGKGAEKSEDELKIFARTDGQPVIVPDGKISVIPFLKISGDVGLETGHIAFDGRIEIRGSVQEGFRVKGERIDAEEILAAEIESSGDVLVMGGILGARITVGGNLKARYIRGGRIDAAGDVVVENEILDSEIETSGVCHVEKGKILSSRITAKKGVIAGDIGSEASKPCTIVVGVDERIERRVQEIKRTIVEEEMKLRDLNTDLSQSHEEAKRVGEQIRLLAQVQDRSMVEQRELNAKARKSDPSESSSGRKHLQDAIQALETKAKEAEAALEELFQEEDRSTKEISKLKDQIEETRKRIGELNDDIPALIAWAKNEKGSPSVRVRGKAYAGTLIKGPYSSARLKEDALQSLIREVPVSESGSPPEWKMRFQRLK